MTRCPDFPTSSSDSSDLIPPTAMLIDCHTHRLPTDPTTALLSCNMTDPLPPASAVYLSVGIHPWWLTEDNLTAQQEWVRTRLTDQRVIALGETGLDKRCPTPFPLQEQAFRWMVACSEAHRLPLIIHNVKATAELIALRQHSRARQPWIIHGFRGKKELGQSLLRQGCYLSFGEHYATDTLAAMPTGRWLLETDDSTASIHSLLQRAATIRKQSENQLEEELAQTVGRLFFRL